MRDYRAQTTDELQLAPAFALRHGNAALQLLRLPPPSSDGHISSLASLVLTPITFLVASTGAPSQPQTRQTERERERGAKCSGSSSGEVSEGSLPPSFDKQEERGRAQGSHLRGVIKGYGIFVKGFGERRRKNWASDSFWNAGCGIEAGESELSTELAGDFFWRSFDEKRKRREGVRAGKWTQRIHIGGWKGRDFCERILARRRRRMSILHILECGVRN